MKKYLVLLVLGLFALPLAMASSWVHVKDTMDIVEKDSSDWSTVEDGAHGLIKFTTISRNGRVIQERAKVSVWGLEPKTSYQLIYYGDEDHNDIWPYATCLGRPKRTSTQGYFKSGSAHLNGLTEIADKKFWVVLAEDVDCDVGMMTNWNPNEYLFETRLI